MHTPHISLVSCGLHVNLILQGEFLHGHPLWSGVSCPSACDRELRLGTANCCQPSLAVLLDETWPGFTDALADIAPALLQIIYQLVLVGFLSSFCCWAAGWLILASSARDAVAKHWAHHCLALGQSLSAISAHLLATEAEHKPETARCAPGLCPLGTLCCTRCSVLSTCSTTAQRLSKAH